MLAKPGSAQTVNQFDLNLGRDLRFLVLQAVPWTHFDNFDGTSHGNHRFKLSADYADFGIRRCQAVERASLARPWVSNAQSRTAFHRYLHSITRFSPRTEQESSPMKRLPNRRPDYHGLASEARSTGGTASKRNPPPQSLRRDRSCVICGSLSPVFWA